MPAVTEKCTLLLAILSGPKFALLPDHSRMVQSRMIYCRKA